MISRDIISVIRMNFKSGNMLSVSLIAFSLLSIIFSADNLLTGSYGYRLPVDFASAEISDVNSTKTLLPDGAGLTENTGGESGGSVGSETEGDQCLAGDPGCSGGESSGSVDVLDQCDPFDPSCGGGDQCDPFDPSCSNSPGLDDDDQCDPFDPTCSGGGPPPPVTEHVGGRFACFDGIDNDGDGKTDRADSDCGGGGPPPPTVPEPEPPDPSGDEPPSTTFSETIDRRTILGAAFQNVGLAPGAEAGSPKEDICNDGRDNNNDGRRDSEDPDCSVETTSSFKFDGLPSNISKSSGNVNESHILSQSVMVSDSSLDAEQDNTSIILISPAVSKHDSRTRQYIQYTYSPDTMVIEKCSKVIWINEDPDDLHGIDLKDKISGKTVFSYPTIQSGGSAFHHFQDAGQFTYSDPMFPSMSGEIVVVN